MAQRNLHEWNRQIIEEFRVHEGHVGGPFEDTPLLLLTTTGAKSGQRHVNPLVYLADGERLFVFAAKNGAPTNPDWYYNLRAHPTVTVEVGTERFVATAVIRRERNATGYTPDRSNACQDLQTMKRERPVRSRSSNLSVATVQ